MSQPSKITTVIFDKNMNLIIKTDPAFVALFGDITKLTDFNTFLAKNKILDEAFSSKLNINGREYHLCYKWIDLEDTFEFHFYLLSDDWTVVNPTGRHDIYDQLTQLLTERSLISILRYEIKRAHRDKETYSAIIVDIAHLTDINEAFGYLAGDKIIKAVATTLQANTRGSDILARYKGDKFIVILHKTDKTGALQYVRKLETALESIKFHFDNLDFHAKIHYSIALSVPDDTCDLLLDRLHQGLDNEKANAPSHIEYFS